MARFARKLPLNFAAKVPIYGSGASASNRRNMLCWLNLEIGLSPTAAAESGAARGAICRPPRAEARFDATGRGNAFAWLRQR
jgi:hypothetical protein